jgi:hypothetical protein
LNPQVGSTRDLEVRQLMADESIDQTMEQHLIVY